MLTVPCPIGQGTARSTMGSLEIGPAARRIAAAEIGSPMTTAERQTLVEAARLADHEGWLRDELAEYVNAVARSRRIESLTAGAVSEILSEARLV